MCTVSVIRVENSGDGYMPEPAIRLAFSRDELRTRSRALPPWTFSSVGFRSVMPVDPDSAGTWIAANDRGVVFALMNVNPPIPSDVVPPTSRGKIIPSLLLCKSARESRLCVDRLCLCGYAPFRLLLLDRTELLEAVSDGEELNWRRHDLAEPIMFTSSGLGDHQVDRPRRDLFESMFSDGRSDADTQDTFHEHAWPHARQLSVLMSRIDASTVSHTVVELSADSVTMRYRDLSSDDSPTEQTELRLDVRTPCRI